MRLIDILVEGLVHWPEGVVYLVQDYDKEIKGFIYRPSFRYHPMGSYWYGRGIPPVYRQYAHTGRRF